MTIGDELNEAQRLEDLQAALARAHRKIADEKNRTDEIVNAIYRAAKDAALAMPRPKPILAPKDKRKGRPEVALLHATDWQIGKRTATYSMETCAERIDIFAHKVLKITEIQRKDHPVREAVLMLSGDLVEGIDIFPGQAWELDGHLFEQLFNAAAIIEKLVRTLAANFETVRVVCEYGNHGRIGRYGVNPKGDNVDRMAYKIAQDRTSDLKTVTWQASNDWYQHFTIGNYRVLLVHGDEIKSYSGTPLFAIIKRVSAWAAGIVPTFDDCYMGHWHNPLSVTLGNGNRAFITGSPEDSNTYAAEHLAAQARPSQRLHFIDPERGRVASEYVVWLD